MFDEVPFRGLEETPKPSAMQQFSTLKHLMREKNEFNFAAANDEKEVTAKTIGGGMVRKGFCRRRKEENKKTYKGVQTTKETCFVKYAEGSV